MRILSHAVYRGFGPTLASQYLSKQHQLKIGREVLRQVMVGAGLAKPETEGGSDTPVAGAAKLAGRAGAVGYQRARLVGGRGPKLYLIGMIDDATSEMTAGFVEHDSTEGEPAAAVEIWGEARAAGSVYTDKASLFQTTPKVGRDAKALACEVREPLPPTQIGRALRELGMVWIATHPPEAKGRIERSFSTAQDRLVKGLRVAGACTGRHRTGRTRA